MGEHPDEHAPSINALRRAGDWAGLVRYWLGHALHQPALDAAIALLRKQKVRRAGDWAGLVRYWLGRALHQPAAPDAAIALLRKQRDRKHVARLVKLLTTVSKPPWNLPDELLAALLQETEGAEQATLQMVALFPQTALCEMANDLPPELREEVLQAGIEAADQIVTLGHSLGDLPIQAGFCLLEAYGYRSAGQLDRAEKSFNDALEHYQELLAAHPDSEAKADVATALNNLGTAQSELGRPEAAEDSYTEALILRRELLRAHPDSETAKVAVAGTLNCLGTAQGALGRPEAAEKSFTDAWELSEELLAAHPDLEAAKTAVAITLNSLGTAQSALGRPKAAEKSFTDAWELSEELLAAHPDSESKADVATALNNLAPPSVTWGGRRRRRRVTPRR